VLFIIYYTMHACKDLALVGNTFTLSKTSVMIPMTALELFCKHETKNISPLQVIELDGRHEIVSLVGTLSEGGHLHASLSDVKGGVVGGHVMGDMVVFTTAEIVIGDCCQLEFTREMDDKTGFKELSVHPKLKNI